MNIHTLYTQTYIYIHYTHNLSTLICKHKSKVLNIPTKLSSKNVLFLYSTLFPFKKDKAKTYMYIIYIIHIHMCIMYICYIYIDICMYVAKAGCFTTYFRRVVFNKAFLRLRYQRWKPPTISARPDFLKFIHI